MNLFFRKNRFLLGLIILLTLNSCETTTVSKPVFYTDCSEPRPQMCTQNHVPVCGADDDGDYDNYSNPCSACSDTDVIKYYMGACLE